MALSIDIISDVVCPWCYIGKRRIEAALALYRERFPDNPEPLVRWWPFQLNPDMPAEGVDRGEYLAKKFGSNQVGSIYSRVSAVGRDVGIPFAFAFGTLAGKLGAKRSIFLGLVVYTGICIFAYGIHTEREFYILAVLVGLVQGGTQALSRSLFASMVPKHKSGEFFGFYSVFEKFGGILGPLVFAIAIGQTGSSRGAILWVIAFFVIGGAILSKVNVKEGERAARDADINLRAV